MSVIWLMMNPLYSSWNNALDYSRYPRGNTAPTVLPQMHYCYCASTVHSVPSPRYYREILPIPTVITAVLPHSPLPCHSLVHYVRKNVARVAMNFHEFPLLHNTFNNAHCCLYSTSSSSSHSGNEYVWMPAAASSSVNYHRNKAQILLISTRNLINNCITNQKMQSHV